MRTPVLLAVLAGLVTAATAGAAPRAADGSGAVARAFAIKVVIPGQSATVTATVASPPDAAAFGSGFAYPSDGSIVSSGAVTASAQTDVGPAAVASASSDVTGLSLFKGEITADLVSGRARSGANGRGPSGDVAGSTLQNLTVLGQPVPLSANLRVPLADWGYAIVLEQALVRSKRGKQPTARGFVAALDVHLTADHGGLPAQSEIMVGYAETNAQWTLEATTHPTETTPPPAPAPRGTDSKKKAKKLPKAPEPRKGHPGVGSIIRRPPPGLQPKLTAGGYVFPVYGPVAFSDTFGAPRADVSYHHGDDIFAPLGAPILAVADGTVFSVGWNDIGGNRLWLRDGQGNEFYYAHLSAFTPFAKNGSQVKAGTVLGFVGNTGDAESTPYHLHFEVHPVSLLYLGYDGAVDPTPYLVAWQHLRDVKFSAAAGWVPPGHTGSPAPKPGAILLQVSDISEASGLEPGSLERAFVASVSSEGDGALLRALDLRVG